NNAGDASGVTDNNGEITFTHVTPATYQVCEVLQNGWTNTDPGTTPPCDANVVVVAEQTTTVDFGNTSTGSVSGQKWEDKNANGVKDAGDNGLQSWHIRIFNAADAQVGSDVVTDGSGNFSVNLAPGTYRICEVVQAGWTQSFPNPANTACTG